MMRYILHSALIIFLFNGCIEQIELDSESDTDGLVIFGGINNTGLEQTIQIYRSTRIQNRILPIIGATVLIIDNHGNQGRMFGDSSGIYRLNNSSIEIVPGREYYVDITLISGQRYQSIPQRMPVVQAFESEIPEYKISQRVSSSGVVVDNRVLEISGTTEIANLNSQDFYLRWSVEETYVLRPTDFPDPFSTIPDPFYITRMLNPQRITLFNGEGVMVNSLDKKLLAVRDFDYTFLDRHFFTIYVHSISKEAYDFWSKINVLTNSSGSIFDTPPAKVNGNLFNVENQEEQIVGFFEVSNTTVSRFVTFVDSSPFTVPRSPCEYDRDILPGDYPSFCLECLEEDGCSLERPPFFDG